MSLHMGGPPPSRLLRGEASWKTGPPRSNAGLSCPARSAWSFCLPELRLQGEKGRGLGGG